MRHPSTSSPSDILQTSSTHIRPDGPRPVRRGDYHERSGRSIGDSHPLAKENTGDIIRKVAWRLMPLIMLCYLFAFFDRINISFAKFQLQSDLGFSDTAYGLGASLFVIGYVLFEVPSNLMLYKVGARKWIARIMISWGLATTMMVFVNNEWQFYGLRFIIGAMEAGFAPGVLYYLTLWFPASYRGRITSLLFLASAFSGLVGAPLSGLVLGHMNGVLGMPGWHWLFLLGGLPCVALGILVLKVLKDRIEDAGWLSASEKTFSEEPDCFAKQAGARRAFALRRDQNAWFSYARIDLLPDSGCVVWAQLLGAAFDPRRRHEQSDDHRSSYRRAVRVRGDLHGRGRPHVG